MVADIEQTVIFKRTTPAMIVYGDVIIGEATTTITRSGDTFVTSHMEKPSVMHEKAVSNIVSVDPEMLEAMIKGIL